ncbi:MAG: 50S ribosomal protein L7 [Eubacterium sp.]|nr:50S ribosomal protein L7 [Eubacterium sp.]
MNRFLSTLGLCRRAGKLAYGFDAVCDEIKKKGSKVCGVFTACDLSEKTLKEVGFICDKYSVPHICTDVSMDEIKAVLSARTGIIAILDKGLFGSLSSLYIDN